MMQKTPKEYEDIIRKLIFSNAFKRMWQPADGKDCSMSINFGLKKLTWTGSSETNLDVPINNLFRQVMGYDLPRK